MKVISFSHIHSLIKWLLNIIITYLSAFHHDKHFEDLSTNNDIGTRILSLVFIDYKRLVNKGRN